MKRDARALADFIYGELDLWRTLCIARDTSLTNDKKKKVNVKVKGEVQQSGRYLNLQ